MAKLKAAYRRLLEQVFRAEIEGMLPYQSKSKKFEDLEAEGLVERMTRTFGKGALSVSVEGWALTHAGRFTYCESCTDVSID